ncbi:1,4-dihydroxy-2-naphthoate polyprenyltransferase [Ferrimonas gelatinilytica]|uniref:1,4-dihydroxy-2-naphthoate octaprenyltransferase n=2 Tax=Ferrimonas gelatinilytica TaxID=1255257 RepID=A0ABP9S9Z4_9GAMM
MAIRPRTLPAAIAPLLLGNVLAYSHDSFSWAIALSAMLCGLLLQIGVNLANDYFDFKSGIDTDARLGPTRVTQSGLLTPQAVRNAMALSLLAAVLVGFYLIAVGGWPVVWMALAAVAGALGYSGGPYPLASHGLGEVAAFLFFGLLAVVGVYFIQTGDAPLLVWLLAATVGLLNAAIMLVNNTRDIRTDAQAGKRTVAVRIGLGGARHLYRVLITLPFFILSLIWLLGLLPGEAMLLSVIAAPMALRLIQDFYRVDGPALNPLLGRTAGLTMMFGILLSLGTLWAHLAA